MAANAKQKRLYRLDCKMMRAIAVHEGSANVSSRAVSTPTWHARLGHPGCHALMAVVAEANLEGVVPQELDHVCSAFMCAKQARAPFHRSAKIAESVLDLVHTDVMEPFPVKSWDGSVYAVTLMDDHSRMAEVALLQKNSDVFGCVRDTIVRWERQTGRQVKIVHSDNGTEFKGRLDDFFRGKGIVHHLSADYTLEQNGRAERLKKDIDGSGPCHAEALQPCTTVLGTCGGSYLLRAKLHADGRSDGISTNTVLRGATRCEASACVQTSCICACAQRTAREALLVLKPGSFPGMNVAAKHGGCMCGVRGDTP